MAETIESRYVKSPISLRQLITSSYSGKFADRWRDPIDRNERHIVRLETVTVWKVHYTQGVPAREKVHTFRVRVFNIKVDGTTNYQTTLLMDTLNLDAPIKIRCGKMSKYVKGMSRDQMKYKGICGDFRFRYENIHARLGTLFGRDMTNHQAPKITNPQEIPGVCKHLVTSIRMLISSSFFQRSDNDPDYYDNAKFIKQFSN